MSFTDEKWRAFEDYREMHKLQAVWSIYTIDNLDVMSGITADELVYGNHWGTGGAVRIPLKAGEKTWGELYHAADQAIRQSGDQHHIYIEQLQVQDNATFVELMTGS